MILDGFAATQVGLEICFEPHSLSKKAPLLLLVVATPITSKCSSKACTSEARALLPAVDRHRARDLGAQTSRPRSSDIAPGFRRTERVRLCRPGVATGSRQARGVSHRSSSVAAVPNRVKGEHSRSSSIAPGIKRSRGVWNWIMGVATGSRLSRGTSGRTLSVTAGPRRTDDNLVFSCLRNPRYSTANSLHDVVTLCEHLLFRGSATC